ncbi:uncharacterized protein LOC116344233 [Contarinia nasturtii]|uniref:uncharacterized protein LOC116344233 n=1 Tax=Contarinia nasturtii TaxID=265458 RepID=UPI0012D39A4A|nr:uncharacterized protein LOC116344233 [Contarinia nasturtii]
MKFLIVCMCALMATVIAAESKKQKRGLLPYTDFTSPTQTFLSAATPLTAAPLPLAYNQLAAQLPLATAQFPAQAVQFSQNTYSHESVPYPVEHFKTFPFDTPVSQPYPVSAVKYVQQPFAVEQSVAQPVYIQQQPQAVAHPVQHVQIAQSQPIAYAAQSALLAHPTFSTEQTFSNSALATPFAVPALSTHQVPTFGNQVAFAAPAFASQQTLAAPAFAHEFAVKQW